MEQQTTGGSQSILCFLNKSCWSPRGNYLSIIVQNHNLLHYEAHNLSDTTQNHSDQISDSFLNHDSKNTFTSPRSLKITIF